MYRVIIIVLILSNLSCKGQNKKPQKEEKKMVQQLDSFDIKTFDKHKDSELKQYEFYKSNGDYVQQSEEIDFYTETTHKANSKFSDYKIFFKNGKLKELGSLYDRVLIGDYKYFNEKGETSQIKNFENHYKFTLEDVLQYCKDNTIVEKEKTSTSREVKIHLWRTDSSSLTENDPIFWTISYGLIPYTPKGTNRLFATFFKITLDGKTGKEIKKEYKRAKIDDEWHLIEN